MSSIALLFLTYGGILHEHEFNDWFTHEQCNIYLHPKNVEEVPHSQQQYITAEHINTQWGDKSIVQATMELLKASYKETNNKWFILCSGDMYPLTSPDEFIRKLTNKGLSIFNEMHDRTRFKTSQFWAMTRDDVHAVIRASQTDINAIYSSMPRKAAADELFFLPLLKRVVPSHRHINEAICYTKWLTTAVSKHPTTFRCLLPTDKEALQKQESYFIRKTTSDFKPIVCPMKNPVLVVYGTHSPDNYDVLDNDNITLFVLSLVGNVNHPVLVKRASQIFHAVWGDVTPAVNEIKEMIGGTLQILLEEDDPATLKIKDNISEQYNTGMTTANADFENSVVANEVLLKLGDVIYILDSVNETLHKQMFLIEYIDPFKVKLVNGDTFQKVVLPISPDGVIGDGTIETIRVMSSNPLSGFARQNGLITGVWVNIYFGGDVPVVFTAQITNLEEDMIELKTTDNDTLFINFAYQGIPEDLDIELFEIRSPPTTNKVDENAEVAEYPDTEDTENIENPENPEVAEKVIQIPTKQVTQHVNRMFSDFGELQFGEIIQVEEKIAIGKDKYRYNIETQTNDLLEEMIAHIPNHQRTTHVLANLQLMVQRFLQLRKIASTFDDNHNVTGVVKKTPNDKPLADYLAQFKCNLQWIKLVATQVKKVYPEETVDGLASDVSVQSLERDITEISNMYITNRKSRANKTSHSNFTYQSFDQIMTPFEPEHFENAIGNGTVTSDIDAIVDNLGDLYSTVMSNAEVTSRRFVIQRYNLAYNKLDADNFKGSHLITHRIKVPNDPISVQSLLTLPEPTVKFSKINLPETSLLERANLNMHFLNYWQLLGRRTKVDTIELDSLDEELTHEDNNFIDTIKHYTLAQHVKDEEHVNQYKSFLKMVIPKIKVLFHLVKKYINGRLSLVEVVKYLEPFMVYPDNITYTQMLQINSFIYDKIKEYNVKFREYGMAFSSLKYVIKPSTANPLEESFFNLLERFKSIVVDKYELEHKSKQTVSEITHKMIETDCGKLITSSIAMTNLNLSHPGNLPELFEQDSKQFEELIHKQQHEKNKCATRVLVKKYYDDESLKNDNGKTVYVDKQFDKTDYDIVNEKYKKQRDELTHSQFIQFLTQEFKNKKYTDNEALLMATTLANQAKPVQNGEYAVLITQTTDQRADSMEYYIRENDEWVHDKNINENHFINDSSILCNIDYSCLFNANTSTCESNELNKAETIQKGLNQIMTQFDKEYTREKADERIMNIYVASSNAINQLKKLREIQRLKYNTQKHLIGLEISDEMLNVVVSPHAHLRNLILGQIDFAEKQHNILKFASSYCYEGNNSTPNAIDGEMESEWWMYCKDTNVKLLPKFYVILATTFVTNPEKYMDTIEQLKKQIGKLSDDGNAWVDQNSGEIICYIDADVTEGYKDGFVDKTREVMELTALDKYNLAKEAASAATTTATTAAKRLSPEGTLVSNVITTISANMGIDLESSRETIIRIVTELLSNSRILTKETDYRKMEEEAAKKGKKLPAYSTVYGSVVMYLTLGMYTIAVQTSVPPIQTRKTAPGCVRSFSGFPFDGEGDESALTYVSCVALKSRDPTTVPWSSLPKSPEKITSTLKSFITKYLITLPEVEQMMKIKAEYLLSNPDAVIPAEHDLTLKWPNFLPPLRRFDIKTSSVSNAFGEELHHELIAGNPKQYSKLMTLEAKIMSYALEIQAAIQHVVDSKEAILKAGGQPFVDNACCNDADLIHTTLQYFSKEEPTIDACNKTVAKLTELRNDVLRLSKSAIMLSQLNTKRPAPVSTNEMSEETIYRAFITLCKFTSTVALTDDVAAICVDKPDYLKKYDSIQEKITKLKRDGRNYTKEQFVNLFQVVSRNNIITMPSENSNQTCKQQLTNAIHGLADGELRNMLMLTLTNNDEQSQRQIRNWLQTTNERFKKDLLQFIDGYGKLPIVEFRNLTAFLKNLGQWRFNQETNVSRDLIVDVSGQLREGMSVSVNYKGLGRVFNAKVIEVNPNGTCNVEYETNPRTVFSITDDGLNNIAGFMKNHVTLFAVIFPSLILNNKQISSTVPKHWELSDVHEHQITDMTERYYDSLYKFMESNKLTPLLEKTMSNLTSIVKLTHSIPLQTAVYVDNQNIAPTLFERKTTTLLLEHCLLQVFIEYIRTTTDTTMHLGIAYQEMIAGNTVLLNQEVAKLLWVFLKNTMQDKKRINMSYDNIQEQVFQLKEAEKYDFTDKLKDLTEEERAVDTALKHNKIGALYTLGTGKKLMQYNEDHFMHDKAIAENVAKIQKRLQRRNNVDFDDVVEDMHEAEFIDRDNAMNVNDTDDYNDGDPWGEEGENEEDYD